MVLCQTSSLQCIRAHLWLSHEQHKIPRVSIAERESNGSSTHWLLFPLCQLLKMIGQHKSFMWSQSVLFTLTWFYFFSSGLLGFLLHWMTHTILNPQNFAAMEQGWAPQGNYFPLTMQNAMVLPSEWGLLMYLCIEQEYVLSQDLCSLFNLQNERLITLCWQHLRNIDGAYCFSYNQELL